MHHTVDDITTATTQHPAEDYLPAQYITALNKKFLYAPGKGSSYSSDGIVLLGMALVNATGTRQLCQELALVWCLCVSVPLCLCVCLSLPRLCC